MQTYHVRLEAPVSKSFRCTRAANSLDIDVDKKSVHELKISADLTGDYQILLILGASGSGKTTLAKEIFGENCFETYLDVDQPVIEQFPKDWSYDECAMALSGVGLTSVPCWIKPAYTLSNGQRARAESALAIANSTGDIVIDEWTSVVDRTVAKVMSHCVQKFVRRQNRKIVLVSCHYDVIEWLDPDLIIDCNKQEFIDRRLLPPQERTRREKIQFEIRPVNRKAWSMFSKYHYLSDSMPGGLTRIFGLFHGQDQIGFQCFANYVPRRSPGAKVKMHSNRTVIHPDYAGFGLGLQFINATSQLVEDEGYEIWAKFSSIPLLKARLKSPYWQLMKVERNIGNKSQLMMRRKRDTMRVNVKTFSFRFLGIPRADFLSLFRRDLADSGNFDLENFTGREITQVSI